MASLTTIYRNKNSHSHMIKSHDWLKQNINNMLQGSQLQEEGGLPEHHRGKIPLALSL
jgi:hypothetical protein